MTLAEILLLVAAIGGPLSGITIALIVDNRSKRSGRSTTEVAMAEVEVSEKQAHNEEIAVIIEGFSSSMAGLRADVADARVVSAAAKLEAANTHKDYVNLRSEHDALRKEHDARVRMEEEMLLHIIALEGLVPNPPGPPKRPAWVVTPPVNYS